MTKKVKYTLLELSSYLNAELIGEPNCEIIGIAPLDSACDGQISFLENKKYNKYLESTKASAVILRADYANGSLNALIVPDPYIAYAKLTFLFNNAPVQREGVHSTVIFGSECCVENTAKIGEYCVLGNGVRIAANVTIGTCCVIGDSVEIGEGSHLYPNVTLYHNVKLGKRVIVHSGAVIGADGFGMANSNGKWNKIYHLGGVTIHDDVEIGANTTVDRGALSDTIIEEGAKLDNQIQIAHNVKIGANTAIAGCTGIAGSTVIGKNCMIAGGVGISGHINICDGVFITAQAGIKDSISSPGVYSSSIPAIPQRQWWRIVARLMKLDDLAKRISALEKAICHSSE